jgi:isochorismate pyruvate lyase
MAALLRGPNAQGPWLGTDVHTAEQCESLVQVRAEIDRLDEQIVRLLAERGGYVLAAARFKNSVDEVPAPQRVEQVIAHVRALALQHGALPEVVERAYRTMIAAFIEAEQRHWLQQGSPPGAA